MKTKLFETIISLFMLINFSFIHAYAEEYVPGELIVDFRNQGSGISLRMSEGIALTGLQSIDSLNQRYGCYFMEKVYRGPAPPAQGLYLIKFPVESDLDQLSSIYGHDSNVNFAEPNSVIELADITPNDSLFPQQWHLDNDHLDCPSAWDYTTGSSEVVISVNDNGIDWNHPDLTDNIWQNLGEDADQDGHVLEYQNGEWVFDPGDIDEIDNDGNGYLDDLIGWDFGNNNNDVSHSNQNDYHGTHMSGVAASIGNNSIGTCGISWHSKIMMCKVGLNLNLSDAVAGIYYAADNGAKVINMSWTNTNATLRPNLKAALDYAYSVNVVLCAAAGNFGLLHGRKWPAAYEKVIGVCATDMNDQKAYFSVYGEWYDVSAPGVDIWTTNPQALGPLYAQSSGTSPATAIVSGLASLIISLHPGWSNDQVMMQIKNTTDFIDHINPGYEGMLGTGRVNAFKALSDPFTLSGTIYNQLTLDGDYTVSDDLFIEGSLIVEEGSTIQVNDGKKIVVTSNGFLTADGALFSSLPGFPEPGRWEGILLDHSPSERTHFANCTFEYATNGIYALNSAVDITGSTFRYCETGFLGDYASGSMSFSHFSNNTLQGAYFSQSSVGLSNNRFENNGARGMYLQYSSGVTLDNNVISYNAAEPLNQTVTGGLILYQSSPRLTGNRMESNVSNGILTFSTSDPLMNFKQIAKNRINENGVEDNDPNNGEIQCVDYYPTQIDYGHNDIMDSRGGWLIYCGSEATPHDPIAIRGNYWGTTDEYEIDARIYGDFEFTPFDMSPNVEGGEYSEEMLMFQRGVEAEINQEYSTAVMIYDSLVQVFPNHSVALNALTRKFACYDAFQSDMSGLRQYYLYVYSSHSNQSLTKHAKRLSIACLLALGQYAQAITEYDEVKSYFSCKLKMA